MRVIDNSGRHDYYDTMMAHDQDRKVIYHRQTRNIIFFDGGRGDLCLPMICPQEDQIGQPMLIGWCGQVITGMYIPIIKDSSVNSYSVNTFYSVEAINKAIFAEEAKPRMYQRYDLSWWSSDYGIHYKRQLRNWFTQGEVIDSDFNAPVGDWRRDSRFTDLFSEHNTPAWVLHHHSRYQLELLINPLMKVFNFQVVKDVHTAWMELSAYVGGVLTNPAGVEPRPMDDTLKRDLHGFDSMSFKRSSTKAEKRAKRRKQ